MRAIKSEAYKSGDISFDEHIKRLRWAYNKPAEEPAFCNHLEKKGAPLVSKISRIVHEK
jgi:hypothetical protein